MSRPLPFRMRVPLAKILAAKQGLPKATPQPLVAAEELWNYSSKPDYLRMILTSKASAHAIRVGLRAWPGPPSPGAPLSPRAACLYSHSAAGVRRCEREPDAVCEPALGAAGQLRLLQARGPAARLFVQGKPEAQARRADGQADGAAREAGRQRRSAHFPPPPAALRPSSLWAGARRVQQDGGHAARGPQGRRARLRGGRARGGRRHRRAQARRQGAQPRRAPGSPGPARPAVQARRASHSPNPARSSSPSSSSSSAAQATIVLPENTGAWKQRSLERLGAAVLLHGRSHSAAMAHCVGLAKQSGRPLIPSFDDP